MPCLRRLVAGLSPRRPGFCPRTVHVGFAGDSMALEQVLLRVSVFLCYYSSAVYSTPFSYSFVTDFYSPSTGHTLHMRDKADSKLPGAGHEKVDRTNSRPEDVAVLNGRFQRTVVTLRHVRINVLAVQKYYLF